MSSPATILGSLLLENADLREFNESDETIEGGGGEEAWAGGLALRGREGCLTCAAHIMLVK